MNIRVRRGLWVRLRGASIAAQEAVYSFLLLLGPISDEPARVEPVVVTGTRTEAPLECRAISAQPRVSLPRPHTWSATDNALSNSVHDRRRGAGALRPDPAGYCCDQARRAWCPIGASLVVEVHHDERLGGLFPSSAPTLLPCREARALNSLSLPARRARPCLVDRVRARWETSGRELLDE